VPRLSLEEVQHIAHLARLGLSDAEKETFRDQLSAILDYAARLNELDTRDVEPTTSALPLHNVMRDDEVAVGLSSADALSNAPDAEADQFRVRVILE
jgi:aspartyl-tRNA(Asn)/glutamyl-tRNA(Gln) amidotransferase subunit C